MKLYNELDFRILVADYETLNGCTTLGFFNPDTGKWTIFEMSKYRNDIYKFIKFYLDTDIDFVCGFNFINFDQQVTEFILSNYEKWNELNGEGVAEKIYEFVQDLIDRQKYGLFVPYREENFRKPVLDVFTILGLNNEARWTSLKKAEFQLDFPSVEEMPIHHSKKDLSKEEIELVIGYMKNDILATYEILKLVIGETEHPIYKGNNQLELRATIQEEFGLNCFNYSDIKIGDELMKLGYCEAKGIHIKDLPKKGTFRKGVDLKRCIPKYVKFESTLLQKLLEDIKNTFLATGEKWEREFKIGNTKYIQALGGLHSVNNGEVYKATNLLKIKTIDVSSMYPATTINNKLYPYHLGKEFLIPYERDYNTRIENKPLSKTNKKIKGKCDGLKLQLNVVFGKMGSMDSWLYDLQALYSITLGGQFSILMLIEKLELIGFKVIIANTDGIEVLVPVEREKEFNDVCSAWEKTTGYILEGDEYERIYMSTVNDYIAFTTSEKMKVKGDLVSDFEIYKNKSNRVIALALQEYFKSGTDPIEFIKNHKNIYDFCIMGKASGQLYLEMQNSEEVKKVNKLVRYYLSSNSDWQLYKRGTGSTGKPANISLNAANELGEIYIQYFNQFKEGDYNINYTQYILKTLKLIDKIEKTQKAKKYVESLKTHNQIKLF